MSESGNKCESCGSEIEGGRPACYLRLEDFIEKNRVTWPLSEVSMLIFDAYCLQHPEKYCVSAKSYYAHLCRLDVGLNHNNDPNQIGRIQTLLNGTIKESRPAEVDLSNVAPFMTFLRELTGDDADREAAYKYAESVWEAYKSQHHLAKSFLEYD